MAHDEFKYSLSISTIAGSSFPNFIKALRGKKVEKGFRLKLFFSALMSAFAEPFRWVENIKNGRKIAQQPINQDPIFILGHWRSGTTYLHNLMCQDPEMAFVTTYQGIFPNQLLSAKWFFKTLMRLNMPRKRAADNVELSPDYPQEEEFALGNMNPYNFYYFWYFPNMTRELCEKYIMLNGFEGEERQRWKDDYKTLMKKSLINTGGSRFISKNPPHTGRIPLILEMFPNARFIHIYRNPLTVFPSTVNFFTKTMPTICFQHMDRKEVEENIFYVYEKMMRKFEEDKQLIPPQNLIEIRYEEFEKAPLEDLKRIYQQLNLPGFDASKQKFEAYIASQQEFQANNHKQSKEDVDRIVKHWQFSMEQWGYEVPNQVAQPEPEPQGN